MRVGIVGAGIGGLAAALACNAAGLDVEIFESAPALEPLGAGIQLSANATRVLRALGVLEAIAAHSVEPYAVQFRAFRSGRVIAQRPLGPTSEARYGAPYLHVHRGDLQAVLANAVSQRSIPLRLGHRCVGFEQNDLVSVAFADGSRREVDVLLGCDGIRSAVRAALFGPESPRFTGNVAWRGLVPTDAIAPGLVSRTVTVWLGPRKHFVHYYVSGGAFVNLVGVVETDRWTEESWTTPGDKAEMQRDFADWHPMLGTLIGASTGCFKWALYDRDPLPAWSQGRVSLLGDACHPMLPFLAQGAASAIEDAWVVSRQLADHRNAPAAALDAYQRARRPRTARMQLGARAQGRLFHEPSASGRLRRNLKLGFGSRFTPGLVMRQLDWIHAHDVLRPDKV